MWKSPALWLAALWVGIMIHVDWHLGRAGHHRSFDLAYHWLSAVPTFVPVPWLAFRKWPASVTGAAVAIAGVGILIGQGLEPLGETIHFSAGVEPFTNLERWRVFGEFIVAGLITLAGGLLVARWYRAQRLYFGRSGPAA